LCYSAYHWLIGLVIAQAQDTAKIGAKSLIGQKKLFQSLRPYAVKWQFWAKISYNPLGD
jgi:hypothetical protein